MSYKFSLDFQKHILASIISDEKFMRENWDVIRPDFFGDEILGGIAAAAIYFYTHQKEVPTKASILQEIKGAVAPGRKLHEYKDGLEEVWKLVGQNAKYYQDQALQFARSQAVSTALREAVPLLATGDIDEIGRVITSALKIGSGSDTESVYDYFGSAVERIKHYLNGNSREERLATGLSLLDDCMNGGLAKGELGVVVALPKHGKTTTLVNFGARALLQNKKIIYFTLELSKKMIASKFDSSIFGRSLEAIKSAPKEFATALRDMRDNLTGKLYIAEFPTKGLTVGKMGGIIQKIGGVDLVLVDYGQLVKSPTRREDRRHEISEIYESLRRLAGELQVPIWTAHQANRPGSNAKVLLPEHLAEDFNVAAITDISVSINHNEEEGRRGSMRLYVMGSRIGPSGIQLDCSVNWRTCQIKLTC